MGQYIKIVSEDFQSKLRPVIEMQQAQGEKIDNVKEKADATFEMVGDMKKDIEIIKSDISFIKQELKHKVDRDEFEALEKRVIFLENKYKRI